MAEQHPPAIIAHYHVYKNAGSTVDQAIIAAVGQGNFIEIDKTPRYRGEAHNLPLIRRIREENPGMTGFSSHTFVASAHRATDLIALPIVFLRHPLMRLASVYRFEAVSPPHRATRLGALAASASFPEWLEAYLDHYDGKNYQTCILSMEESGGHSYFTNEHPGHLGDIKVAATRLDEVAELMGVGIVESFDSTAAPMEARIREYFPNFSLSRPVANQTKKVEDWREELRALERSLPKDLHARMVTRNASDFALYHRYSEVG
ncbi:hypothetical protein [Pseudoroseicyclus sp. CXY001]|uniref:hypothetical protein n=1 Tax=Pseudoroseicyclus sp. CXY001 TaxID=3242492 RepID=UPI003570C988